MAVSIVENWSEIEGIICALNLPTQLRNFTGMEVVVESVKPVAGFPNLLQDASGKKLAILAPTELLNQLDAHPGDRITCRVRRGGPHQIFIHQMFISIEPGDSIPDSCADPDPSGGPM